MIRYLIVLFLILLTNFSFSQRTVILTQTQNDAIKGIDRKAWAGLGNTGPLSDGYANDFTLPARINPCEKITNIKVDVIFSGYTKVGACPHFETYFNIFYGCTTYAGGATCPTANVLSETFYPVNTNPATRNFAIGDFGGNFSVDIIAVSNPGCNPVTNGELIHNYTTTVTVTIEEDLPTTPTFTQVAPICSGGSLSALPTTSDNSISGTWAPALDNTATTTYTFTPNSDECAASTTMTIVVNPLTLVITDPAPVCAPSTINLTLPAVTAGSDSGTLTYWTDAAATIALINPNAVSTSGTYYIKNMVSGCLTIRPVVVTINSNSIPAPTVTTPVYLCQNSPGVPLTANAAAGFTLLWYTIPAGGIGSPTAPSPSTTIVGPTTYYVSQTDGICESSRTPIVVNVVADNGATILNLRCDPSQIPPADINTSVFFDWSNNVLINDNSYNYSYTIQGGPPVTGTRIESNLPLIGLLLPGQSATIILTATRFPCAPAQTMTCTAPCVTTATPTFNPIAPFCTGTIPVPLLPASSIEGITGTWSPAVINNTTSGSYVFTPDPILFPCALVPPPLLVTVTPLVIPAFSSIPAVVCQGAPVLTLPLSSNNATPITGTWSPATVDTSVLGPVTYTFTPTIGQCASATLTTATITILPNVTPSFVPIPAFCSGTAAPLLLTTSPIGITGTWSPATISNTISGNYLFTPNPNQCSSTQTLSVTIIPRTIPDFAAISPFCSGSVSPILAPTSPNGVSGTWSPATISTTASGSYLFTPNATECATTQTLSVTVNPNITPLFNPVPAVCNGSIIAPLPTTSTNLVTGTWSPAVNNTLTTLYTFTPTAGLCATTTTLTINVNPIVAPNFAPIPNVCSGSTAPILATTSPSGIVGTWSPATINNIANGSYTFTPAAGQCSNTETLNVAITPRIVTNFAAIPAICSGSTAPFLATTSPNGVVGTWSPATISNTISGNYVFTPNATECATSQTLNVVINPLVEPNFVDLSICSGTTAPILTSISPNGITGTWSPSIIDNSASGAYVFTPDAPQCATSKTINVTVNPSNTLVAVDWVVTNAFAENQIVTIIATDAGNYLYQLDSGPFQTSPIFENVALGMHSITVKDVNDCSTPITDNNVLVIGYPKFFTPNGDSFNDTWNIVGFEDQLKTRIYIFDRYGKLLKDISASGSGWDGNYIGNPMPASDYWFTVEYSEQGVIKEFKSHFSLKR